MQDQLEYIGMMIRKRRKALGVKQSVLCEVSGLSRWGIYCIENGRSDAKISTLIKIASALETDIDHFFTETGPESLMDKKRCQQTELIIERLRQVTPFQRRLIYQLLGEMGAK